jgi:hypothetical protein
MQNCNIVEEEKLPKVKTKSGPSIEQRIQDSKKKLTKKFKTWIEGEYIEDRYTATLKTKFLLSGRVYATNKRIIFHSFFNSKTLFGMKGTVIPILYERITSFEKKCFNDMRIFPNSVAIKCLNDKGEEESYFITSMHYGSRNEFFDLVTKCYLPHLALTN